MVIGRNRPDPTKKTQQFGAAAASYSPRRSRRSNEGHPSNQGLLTIIQKCVSYVPERVSTMSPD